MVKLESVVYIDKTNMYSQIELNFYSNGNHNSEFFAIHYLLTFLVYISLSRKNPINLKEE